MPITLAAARVVPVTLLNMAAAHGVAAPTHQALYRFLRKEQSAEQAMLALEARSSQDGPADVGRRRDGS